MMVRRGREAKEFAEWSSGEDGKGRVEWVYKSDFFVGKAAECEEYACGGQS